MSLFKNLLKRIGPGFITGAADDDPSGIATYSAAGAQYQFKFLWSALFTLPLMVVVQEMCARIGMVTGRGLAGTLKTLYNKKVLAVLVLLLFVANTFNIGADLGMMAASINLLLPGLPISLLIVIVTAISLILEILVPYERYAKFLKWLCFSLLAYWVTAFMVTSDWGEVLWSTIVIQWQWNADYLMMLVAFLGTTISPYLFFWQASEEVEDEIGIGRNSVKARRGATVQEIKNMRRDTIIGMIFSNISTYFIVLTTAGTLYAHGITQIDSAADAALALRPFAGDLAYFLFTIGIVGTGLLAVPVLAGSVSYALAEVFRWREGLSLQWRKASGFYGVMATATVTGVLMNFIGLNPILALIYAAVINGLTAPIFIWFIIKTTNNKKLMGDFVNSKLLNILGWLCFWLMAGTAIAFLISLF